MPFHDPIHFEFGESHPLAVDTEATFPVVSVTQTTSDSYPSGGAYSQHWDFASNDRMLINAGGFGLVAASAADARVAQFVFKIVGLTDIGSSGILFTVGSDGDSSQDAFLNCQLLPNGSLTARTHTSTSSATGTSFGGAPAATITDSTWHVMTLRWVPSITDGVVQVAVDNVLQIDNQATGDNWPANGNPSTSWGVGIRSLGGSDAAIDFYLANIIVGDDLAIWAPIVLEAIAADGVTAENDGVVTGAPTAWEAVDEVPVSTAEFFELSAVSDAQGLTFANRTQTGTPQFVQLWGSVDDPASGSEQVAAFLNDGTDDQSAAQAVTTSVTARSLGDLETLTPSGGAWSTAAINALEAGLRRTA